MVTSDDLTMSPDPYNNTFRLESSSSHSTDNSPGDCGGERSPSDPDPLMSRRTSVQPVPGRTTDGGRTTSITNSISTKDLRASSTTLVQRVGTTLSTLFVPERRVGKAPGFRRELRTILFGSRLNVLLLTIPISWALRFAKPQEYTLVFVFSILAIIPLAKSLAFATNELSIRVGETLAELLSVTLGNAVELIVAILALVKCELRVVQSSLVGSILADILLVLGLCFFAGGTKFSEQGFALSATQINSCLLALSVTSILLPAAFNMVAGRNQIDGFDSETEQRCVLKLSRGVAVVFLIIYCSYLVFQLCSHKRLYDNKNVHKPETIGYAPRTGLSAKDGSRVSSRSPTTAEGVGRRDATRSNDDQEGEQMPKLSLLMALILLLMVVVLIGITAEGLVHSIDGLANRSPMSKEFIGLILLPIVVNAPECFTATTVSVEDKLTSSLVATVGSSIQTTLFVIPFIVILGWIIDRPITMLFDSLECIVLFLSVFIVNYIVQNGRSNWLKGMILICLYVVVALVFYFYPGSLLDGLLTCPTQSG